MYKEEISQYIEVRNHELSRDEILFMLSQVIDNDDINHIDYDGEVWKMWTKEGNEYWFKKRNW